MEKRKMSDMISSSAASSRDPRKQKRQMDEEVARTLESRTQADAVASKDVDPEPETTGSIQDKSQMYLESMQVSGKRRRNIIIVDCDISAGSILWSQNAPERIGRYRFASINEKMFVDACNYIESEAQKIEGTEVYTH